MRRTFRPAAGLLILAVAGASAAHAQSFGQTIDQAGAEALRGQLRDWLGRALGPRVSVGDRPIDVVPMGDHYRLSVPIAGPAGTSGYVVTGDPVTADVLPIDGTRWAIANLTYPSPVRIEAKSPPTGAPRAFGLTAAAQHRSGVLDTSLATESSLDSDVHDYALVAEQADILSTTHLDRLVSHTAITPAADGTVDIAVHSDGQGLHNDSVMKDGKRVAYTVGHLTTQVRGDHARLEAFPVLLTSLIDLSPYLQERSRAAAKVNPNVKPRPPQPLSPAARAQAHALLAAMSSLIRSEDFEGTGEDVGISAQGFAGSLRKVSFAGRLGADDGKLSTSMSMGFDQFDSPQIPAGPTREFLPRHVVLRLRFGGVPAQAAMDLANHAIDSDDTEAARSALSDEGQAVMAAGPATFGIDELSVDLGPATLHAVGDVLVAGASAATAHATLEMTGLDALTARLNAIPQAKQAAPMLIFLKGLGRQEGAKTIWSVVFDGTSLTVNGTDMSSLIPQGSK